MEICYSQPDPNPTVSTMDNLVLHLLTMLQLETNVFLNRFNQDQMHSDLVSCQIRSSLSSHGTEPQG